MDDNKSIVLNYPSSIGDIMNTPIDFGTDFQTDAAVHFFDAESQTHTMPMGLGVQSPHLSMISESATTEEPNSNSLRNRKNMIINSSTNSISNNTLVNSSKSVTTKQFLQVPNIGRKMDFGVHPQPFNPANSNTKNYLPGQTHSELVHVHAQQQPMNMNMNINQSFSNTVNTGNHYVANGNHGKLPMFQLPAIPSSKPQGQNYSFMNDNGTVPIYNQASNNGLVLPDIDALLGDNASAANRTPTNVVGMDDFTNMSVNMNMNSNSNNVFGNPIQNFGFLHQNQHNLAPIYIPNSNPFSSGLAVGAGSARHTANFVPNNMIQWMNNSLPYPLMMSNQNFPMTAPAVMPHSMVVPPFKKRRFYDQMHQYQMSANAYANSTNCRNATNNANGAAVLRNVTNHRCNPNSVLPTKIGLPPISANSKAASVNVQPFSTPNSKPLSAPIRTLKGNPFGANGIENSVVTNPGEFGKRRAEYLRFMAEQKATALQRLVNGEHVKVEANPPPAQPVKRKRGRPRKSEQANMSPSKRSADRNSLILDGWLIKDRSKKIVPRGGVEQKKRKQTTGKKKIPASFKKPPLEHPSYKRIRLWRSVNNRRYYDCSCGARKPCQDLNKIKMHVIAHDQQVWKCPYCPKVFSNNHLQLNAHMKTHKKKRIQRNETPTITMNRNGNNTNTRTRTRNNNGNSSSSSSNNIPVLRPGPKK